MTGWVKTDKTVRYQLICSHLQIAWCPLCPLPYIPHYSDRRITWYSEHGLVRFHLSCHLCCFAIRYIKQLAQLRTLAQITGVHAKILNNLQKKKHNCHHLMHVTKVARRIYNITCWKIAAVALQAWSAWSILCLRNSVVCIAVCVLLPRVTQQMLQWHYPMWIAVTWFFHGSSQILIKTMKHGNEDNLFSSQECSKPQFFSNAFFDAISFSTLWVFTVMLRLHYQWDQLAVNGGW